MEYDEEKINESGLSYESHGIVRDFLLEILHCAIKLANERTCCHEQKQKKNESFRSCFISE